MSWIPAVWIVALPSLLIEAKVGVKHCWVHAAFHCEENKSGKENTRGHVLYIAIPGDQDSNVHHGRHCFTSESTWEKPLLWFLQKQLIHLSLEIYIGTFQRFNKAHFDLEFSSQNCYPIRKLQILLLSDKWQSYKNTCNCYNMRITISSH